MMVTKEVIMMTRMITSPMGISKSRKMKNEKVKDLDILSDRKRMRL